MASLPSNTFLFNYNAKQYDSNTKTFPKTTGQLFDEDLVLNNAITVGDGYVTFNQNSWMVKSYANANDNPFNVTSTNPYFTFIYKTSGWTSDDTNLIANRGSNFNFMMRANRCIFGTEYCIFSPTSNPQIVVIRTNANASFSRQEWDENGNVLSAATATGYYGNTSNSMDFFCGMSNGSENFRKTFYWMYCSRELLTDAEVLKVIKYNDGVPFDIDKDSVSFTYNSGSTTVDISSENPWTASTNDSWITLSQTTGETDATITVSVSDNYNNSANRIGTVSFTDGEEVLTLTIAQRADTRIILKNIYRSGESVKQMFRNGVMIYKQCYKLIFNVDTDSITFDNTGGTYTINITANEKWTMTVPNWLTASSISGTGNASIIISTNSVPQDRLEGNIIINCANKTHTIDVEQKSAGPDLSTPLTFEAIDFCGFNFPSSLSLLGSKNGGEWYSLNGLEMLNEGETLAVKTMNDKSTFAYDGGFYTEYYNNARYNVSGNIMSLLYPENWDTHLDLTVERQFRLLFQYRSYLVSAENLILPATGLTAYAYAGMFEHCSSLTTAPALPAPTVPGYAYEFMFNDCPSLNYIKCLATTLESGTSTQYWTSNVASTGTFVKHSSMNSWSRGGSGIPSNWTVEDDS